MNSRRLNPRSFAATLALLLPLGSLAGAGTAAAAEPPNLVKNPSLELGDGEASCFKRAGWGSEGDWSFVPGR